MEINIIKNLMKNSALSKILIMMFIVLTIVISIMVYPIGFVFADTSIRPSVTNTTKIPEVQFPYEVVNGAEVNIEDFSEIELVDYFSAVKESYANDEIKSNMIGNWNDINNVSVAELNSKLTDELAKEYNSTYTSENFEITYFFDMLIPDIALNKVQETAENHINITFKMLEVKPFYPAPVVLYKCNGSSDWKLLETVKNNNNYTITASFYDLTDDLSSILFIGTKDIVVDDNGDSNFGSEFPWWLVLIIIAETITIPSIIKKYVDDKVAENIDFNDDNDNDDNNSSDNNSGSNEPNNKPDLAPMNIHKPDDDLDIPKQDLPFEDNSSLF